jgi:hypothetical protein
MTKLFKIESIKEALIVMLPVEFRILKLLPFGRVELEEGDSWLIRGLSSITEVS